ncbi:MAG TPA: OmpA family protein [Rhodocyclaceae bacterium]|nr:OmpA family protein [Rhodocyclaceae bacterium]
MLRTTLIALSASYIVLLGGCTGLPAQHGTSDDQVEATPEPDAGFAWLQARDRIGARVGVGYEIEVQTMDDGALLLRLPAAEGFAPDSAAPTPALRAMLEHVAAALAEAPDTEVRVLGHTDGLGSELYNLQLSIQRAEAVMEYLRTRGISLARLSADGRGEAEPIADNASESGRAVNRRVEVVVRPFH